MSSIIRMRNGVIGGLLRKLPAGTAPALGSYPQQSCPTMSRLYGEAVQSNALLRNFLVRRGLADMSSSGVSHAGKASYYQARCDHRMQVVRTIATGGLQQGRFSPVPSLQGRHAGCDLTSDRPRSTDSNPSRDIPAAQMQIAGR